MFVPVALGAVTRNNLCPAFLIAMTRAVLLVEVVAGMLLVIAFFIGKSGHILPLSHFGIFSARKLLCNLGKTAAVAVGVWLLASAVRTVV